MRPPGYEPGELPTAPLRDIYFLLFASRSRFASAKVHIYLELHKLSADFLYKNHKIVNSATLQSVRQRTQAHSITTQGKFG